MSASRARLTATVEVYTGGSKSSTWEQQQSAREEDEQAKDRQVDLVGPGVALCQAAWANQGNGEGKRKSRGGAEEE